MATTKPFGEFNYDPGITPKLSFPSPGLAAQVVVTAINIIRKMAVGVEHYAEANQGTAVNEVVEKIPNLPDETQVRWGSVMSSAGAAMAKARIPAEGANLPMPAYLVENAVGTLTDKMLDAIETLFPEVAAAGAQADAALIAALKGPVGVTYTESVDRLAADTAFAFDQREAFAQERAMLDSAAAAGHRFLPGPPSTPSPVCTPLRSDSTTRLWLPPIRRAWLRNRPQNSSWPEPRRTRASATSASSRPRSWTCSG